MPFFAPALIAALFAVLVVGVNFTLWGSVGALRFIDERAARRARRDLPSLPTPDVIDVAAILPAHNEATVIVKTMVSLSRILPVGNIFVVSDGSTDETAELAYRFGARVLELNPGRGKATAIAEGIRHFDLVNRFKFVLILDADSVLDKEYLDRGLRYFNDPAIAAVAGYATTDWPGRDQSLWTRFLIAYRERVYLLTQLLQKYGQTWKQTNVTYIVPGFASMYRTEALKKINIEAPGLIIEDFNMTFELHHKQLGKVAFDPGIIGYTQDPDNMHDYVRQLKRWQLGFWQTVRSHGIWKSAFSASLILMIVELVLASIFFVVIPVGLALTIAHEAWGAGGSVSSFASHWFDPGRLFFFVFLPDYLLSCFTAAVQRRVSYLAYGLFFFPMRMIDALIVFWAIPAAIFKQSTGRWVSPARR